jgi:hypothetical protein
MSFLRIIFHSTEAQLLKTEVDSGKVTFGYKHFPLGNLHPNAREAAFHLNSQLSKKSSGHTMMRYLEINERGRT